MNVTDEQKQQISRWLEEGLKLSQVQSRLAEAGVVISYMDLKFLLSDLDLKPKDGEAAVAPEPAEKKPTNPPAAESPAASAPADPVSGTAENSPTAPGGAVTLVVDQITKPGSIASGRVTFSDGMSADWFLDQMGRLGLAGPEKTYRPPEADVASFQQQLQAELAKLGF